MTTTDRPAATPATSSSGGGESEMAVMLIQRGRPPISMAATNVAGVLQARATRGDASVAVSVREGRVELWLDEALIDDLADLVPPDGLLQSLLSNPSLLGALEPPALQPDTRALLEAALTAGPAGVVAWLRALAAEHPACEGCGAPDIEPSRTLVAGKVSVRITIRRSPSGRSIPPTAPATGAAPPVVVPPGRGGAGPDGGPLS